jgi:hypothetical protein
VVRRRTVLFGLALLAAPIVVMLGAMLTGRYYYGYSAQSPTPSVPAGNSVSGMSPQPTKPRSSASGMPTEETTAPEETTAFEAPEGTKASSTARIACLLVDQGASSPPPRSTETLNGNSLTVVLTPKVAAHPDGVHIQIDNRLGKSAEYFARPSDES